MKTAGRKIMRKILSSRKRFMMYDKLVFCSSRALTGRYWIKAEKTIVKPVHR
jgi:hypothetical protein